MLLLMEALLCIAYHQSSSSSMSIISISSSSSSRHPLPVPPSMSTPLPTPHLFTNRASHSKPKPPLNLMHKLLRPQHCNQVTHLCMYFLNALREWSCSPSALKDPALQGATAAVMRGIASAHASQPQQLISWEQRQGIMLAGLDAILAAILEGKQASCKRKEPGDAAVAPWNVVQLQQIGDGPNGPVVTVVDKGFCGGCESLMRTFGGPRFTSALSYVALKRTEVLVLPPHRVTALTARSLLLLETYCAELLLEISSQFVKSRCIRGWNGVGWGVCSWLRFAV